MVQANKFLKPRPIGWIRNILKSHKFLREDLDTETQRYRMLEDKYAKLLVEYKLA